VPPGRRRRTDTPAGDSEIVQPDSTYIDLDPQFEILERGKRLMRVYAPGRYGAAPARFRTRGPYKRFDHQRAGIDGLPRVDSRRGILYAGPTLLGCVGEYFSDTGEITRRGNRLARLSVLKPIKLLDLRRASATGAGTIPAISGISQRATTQAWARWWYAHPQLRDVEGLIYAAANSSEDALAIWERARGKIACRLYNYWGLDDSRLTDEVHLAASELHLSVA
jgi:RES domain-containing protein